MGSRENVRKDPEGPKAHGKSASSSQYGPHGADTCLDHLLNSFPAAVKFTVQGEDQAWSSGRVHERAPAHWRRCSISRVEERFQGRGIWSLSKASVGCRRRMD